METIAFDLPQHYPPVPLPAYAEGDVNWQTFEIDFCFEIIQIRSMATSLCIDTKHGHEQAKFGLDQCLKDRPGKGGEQVQINSLNYW